MQYEYGAHALDWALLAVVAITAFVIRPLWNWYERKHAANSKRGI